MNIWLKENWPKVLILLLTTVFVYFQFIRQIIYKKHCAKQAYSGGFGSVGVDVDTIYKICLRKYGF